MTQNNNFSPLPFYGKIEEQYCRLPYTFGSVYPLIAPQGTLLPFQVAFDWGGGTFQVQIEVYCTDGTRLADITSAIINAGLVTVGVSNGSAVSIYPGSLPIVADIPPGRYYMTVKFKEAGKEEQIRYSEMFTVVANMQGYTKIEWWDVKDAVFDAGIIVYGRAGYRNRLYFKTDICKPEYEFEEEGEERDGYFFPEKQISEKKYRFGLICPEYLCDVMRLIPLSDYVEVTDQYGRQYSCDTFLVTVEWGTNADLADVLCEFDTDTVVKKIGSSIEIRDMFDFNDDFNADFY